MISGMGHLTAAHAFDCVKPRGLDMADYEGNVCILSYFRGHNISENSSTKDIGS